MSEEEAPKINPFRTLDWLFGDVLGLPSPTKVFKPLLPREVLKTLGVPTPAEVLEPARQKAEERAKSLFQRGP